jgi:hypothetical protein
LYRSSGSMGGSRTRSSSLKAIGESGAAPTLPDKECRRICEAGQALRHQRGLPRLSEVAVVFLPLLSTLAEARSIRMPVNSAFSSTWRTDQGQREPSLGRQ